MPRRTSRLMRGSPAGIVAFEERDVKISKWRMMVFS